MKIEGAGEKKVLIAALSMHDASSSTTHQQTGNSFLVHVVRKAKRCTEKPNLAHAVAPGKRKEGETKCLVATSRTHRPLK